MPKANGKDAFYFSHDCNARNDNKILAMRSVYGAEGYGLYWMLIEVLREQPDYRYPLSKFAFKSLAMDLRCDEAMLEAFVLECCEEFGDDNSSLLSMDENCLWSESLLRRMKRMDEVSSTRSKAAERRWEKEKSAKTTRSKSTGVDYNEVDSSQFKSPSEIDLSRCGNAANPYGSTADANALQMHSKGDHTRPYHTRPEEKQNGINADFAAAASEEIFSVILDAYHRQTGRAVSVSQRNQLCTYCEAMGTAVVLEAFKIASENDVKSWAYTKRILQDWSDLGVHSVEEAQREHRGGKSGGAGRHAFASGEVNTESVRASIDRLDMLLESMKEEE